MNATVEKGDVLALKDGREVEVLSVKTNGDEMYRFDFIDRKEESPMRRTAYPSEILRLIRKNQRPPFDPKVEQSYDNPKAPPLPVTIVNQDAGPQVHPAVKQPAQPVQRRTKTDQEVSKAQKGR